MRWMMIPAALLLVCGCTAGQGAPPSAASAATPTRSFTPSGTACHGTPVFTQANGMTELRGTGDGVELWALPFAELPFRAGKEIKIVWRMTGDGPLKATASLPDGTKAKRTWGPEEHDGSTWHHPGEEWGTGFRFPKAGCWKVELSRTRGAGYVWLPVR